VGGGGGGGGGGRGGEGGGGEGGGEGGGGEGEGAGAGAGAGDPGSGLAAEAEAAWRRDRAGEAARLRAALPRLARPGAAEWLAGVGGAAADDAGGVAAADAAGVGAAEDAGGAVDFLAPSEAAAAGDAPFLLLGLVVARRRTKGATFVDVADLPPATLAVGGAGGGAGGGASAAARWAAARAALALHAHRDAVDGRDRARGAGDARGAGATVVVDLLGLGRGAGGSAAAAAAYAAAAPVFAPPRRAQLCFRRCDTSLPAFVHGLAAGDVVLAAVGAAGAARAGAGGALTARGALLAHDAARRAGVRREFVALAAGEGEGVPGADAPFLPLALALPLLLPPAGAVRAPRTLRGAARALRRAAAAGARVLASLESDPTFAAPAPLPAPSHARSPWLLLPAAAAAAQPLLVAIVAVRLCLPRALLRRAGAGLAFSSRLSRLANFYMRQQAANALASTVGGGAFLCRQIPLARRAARAQMRVAARLGDARLFARAALHTVYVDAALLRWRRAARRLRALRGHAAAAGDAELLRMVAAAAAHARRARALAASGALQAPVAHFALAVTLPAVGVGEGAGEGGGGGGVGAAGDLLPRYAGDEHYDELHRLRATVPRQLAQR